MASINFIISIIFLVITLLPISHSLTTVAISETSNQTLVCAITNSSFLNCTCFPQNIQIQLNSPFSSISSIVGGDGFICALSSPNTSPNSTMVCWRFDTITNITTYTRVYHGPSLRVLISGNSHVCGLVSGSNSLQCWQWPRFNSMNRTRVIATSLAVGEGFVCGLSDSGQVLCLERDGNVIGNVTMESFSQVVVGLSRACGISVVDGGLVCWGNTTGGSREPEGEFTSVALGENRGCAVRPNGTVVCWGENGFSLPESLQNESFFAVEGKRRVFCGVAMSNYSLFCWGDEGFRSNSWLVFNDVVPGACRRSNECNCGPLPNYGEFCSRGLMICLPCANRLSRRNPALPPPSPLQPTPPPSRRRWNNRMVAFMVVGCVGSFSLLLTLCILLFLKYFKIRGSRIHDSGRLEEGSGSPQRSDQTAQPRAAPVLEKKLSHMISMGNGGHLEEFSLEVLLQVTENFSEEHKIGTGSFGSVYHATLDDGRQVAIKRAEISSSSSYAGTTKRDQENDIAFLNELEFLSRLNHKNLVRLLGYCEDGNERVLVYDYMENGTLSDHLHKLESSPLKSWVERIKVALDAARGIQYLHEYAVPRIIHRDIKSSNILLDSTWTAKVSDFGLSLLGPQDDEPHLALRAAGTMGYMDPEYYRLQLLTAKSDVYSFGIVLLELLSGCKAIHKNENGVPRNVVDYVVPHIIRDEVHRVLDKRLPPPTPFEIEAVAYVGYLAADCVMPEGKDRPTMSEVVNSLDRALDACLAPPVLSRSTTTSSA